MDLDPRFLKNEKKAGGEADVYSFRVNSCPRRSLRSYCLSICDNSKHSKSTLCKIVTESKTGKLNGKKNHYIELEKNYRKQGRGERL